VLLVDGMRLNSAQPAGAVGSFMSLGLADRVEVVKGPASVLYGTGALGGAINVLLPQARFEPGAEVSTAPVGTAPAVACAAPDAERLERRPRADARRFAGPHRGLQGARRPRRPHRLRLRQLHRPVPLPHRRRQQQLRYRCSSMRTRMSGIPARPNRLPHPMPGVAAAVASTTIHSPGRPARWPSSATATRARANAAQPRRARLPAGNGAHASTPGRTACCATSRRPTSASAPTGSMRAADWLAHAQHLLSFGTNLWQMDASPKAPERHTAEQHQLPRAPTRLRTGASARLASTCRTTCASASSNVLAALRSRHGQG
jgi:hemoglobin/transferrin/lactoferrin receptor protein